MPASPPPSDAAGQEVLVLDADDKVLRGLERLLGEAGLIVTGTPDPARARDQIVNKFFSVALADVDTPGPGEGVEFIRFCRDKSPMTTVIALTPRKAFEAALAAFRAGAADMVLKQPDTVGYLKDRVIQAAGEIRMSTDRGRLLEDVGDLHEDFLRRMMDLSKQLVDLEDRVLGRTSDDGGFTLEYMNVLVVDDEPGLFAAMQQALTVEKGWRLRACQSGGEAMDVATQAKIHLAVVKEHLPDLPGSMVIKTIKAASSDAITMLFTPPGAGSSGGEVKVIESSRVIDLIPSFTNPAQLIESLGKVREAFLKKAKERRYLQAFRTQHFEFLKRYNELKSRIAKALQRQDPSGSGAGYEKSSLFSVNTLKK